MAPSPDALSHPEHDYEELAVELLKGTTRVTSLLDGPEWISTRLRRAWDATIPAIRVRRIGGLPTEDRVAHLSRARLQIEGYAPDEDLAWHLTAAALAALRDLGPGKHNGVMVTKVGQDLALTNSPDPDSDAARYVCGVVFWGHWIAPPID